MKKLLSAALMALTALSICAPAYAQVAYTDSADGQRITVPVTPSKPLPVTGTVATTNASVGANSAAAKTSSTLMGVSDGTNQQQVVAPIALGDGVNGNNMVASGAWVWNGSSWDRAPGSVAGAKVNLAASATGGCTPTGYQSAASTNATNVKASAGTLCGGLAINTTATVYYLRLYDLASAPTASSATGFITTIPIPASTTGNGTLLNIGGTFGAAFTNGIGFVLTGGGSSTDNSNAATGVYITLGTK